MQVAIYGNFDFKEYTNVTFTCSYGMTNPNVNKVEFYFDNVKIDNGMVSDSWKNIIVVTKFTLKNKFLQDYLIF